MDIRTWYYQVLSGEPTVNDPVSGRIFAANTLGVVPTTPYIVYKIMPEVPENVGDAKRTQVQTWIHDEPGSYLRIDSILDDIKTLLKNRSSESDFIQARWLDDSEDLYDDGSNTITRYTRFDLVQAR